MVCRQVLQVQPSHPEALHCLGIVAIKVELYDAAVELLSQSMDASPGAAVCCNLGLALKALGQLKSAVEIYREALRYQPDHAAAHNNLANALRKLGDIQGAVRHYQEAIRYQPDYTDAKTNLNSVYNTLSVLEPQLVPYGIALDIPNNWVSVNGERQTDGSTGSANLFNLLAESILDVGIEFQDAGDISNAEDLYQTVRQFSPMHARALHLLHGIAAFMGRGELTQALSSRLTDADRPLDNRVEEPGLRSQGDDGKDSSGTAHLPIVFAEPKYPKVKALASEVPQMLEDSSLDIRALHSHAEVVEIVSATRRSEVEFWEMSALGISLRSMGVGAKLQVNIAFNNQRGLSELYNESIHREGTDRILVFIHDDVWIDDLFFTDRINHGLLHFDVIGVAGNSRRQPHQAGWGFIDEELTPSESSELRGAIAHGNEPFGEVSAFGVSPAECELLDGVILAARKSRLLQAQVAFDPVFKFHFYDMDFCRTARDKKLRVGTWPIHLTHQSEGAFKSAGWKEMYARYLEKWTS